MQIDRGFGAGGSTVSASQPLYRYANTVAYSQAVQQVEQADYTLASARQDLILRVATAYFDVLLAQFNVELAESQKAAVSEQLAQAKRNFEVGVATITDTNEAQAKYDSIVAQEISARNDLDNKRAALRAIIGRFPQRSEAARAGLRADAAVAEFARRLGRSRARRQPATSASRSTTSEIATLEIERQRAGRLPTIDLVASANAQAGTGSVNTRRLQRHSRQALIGLAAQRAALQGGFIDSKVREAIALQESARQNLEVARRNALFNAQTGFTGVNSAAASVKAFEQALVSAQTAYESNKPGQEVGVRTNLDVLNTQQNVFQTRRDLAQAYFNYLMGVLRLKSAVGAARRAGSAKRSIGGLQRLAFASAAASRGSSHAHSRSMAPRCAAMNVCACSRIRSRSPRSREQPRRDARTVRRHRATRSAAPAARAASRRLREVEHVRSDQRRARRRRSTRSGSGRRAAAGCRRRTQRRPRRSRRASRPSNRRARRATSTRATGAFALRRANGTPALVEQSRRPRRSAADGAAR